MPGPSREGNLRRASKLADSVVNNGCKNVTLLRKRGHFTDFFPPSITRNRRRRSGAVSVGSVGATARTASNNSPIDQIWPAIPSAVLYWSVEVALVVAASDVPPADGGVLVVFGEEVAVVEASIVGGGLDPP